MAARLPAGTAGCSVPRCSETACKQSFHTLPVDPDRRDQWLAFLYRDREIPAFLSPRIRVCSLHFADDCFINLAQVNLGFAKRLILKPDSVPTIYPGDGDTEDGSASGVLPGSMERGASHPTKRPPLSSTPHLPRKRKKGRNRKENHPPKDGEATRKGVLFREDLMDTSSRGEVFNSKYFDYFPEDDSTASATPISSREEMKSAPANQSPSSQEQMKVMDWQMPKAILYESCIKELFRKCQCCGKPITDTRVTYVGAQMRVSWECLGGHSGTWTSTPEVRGMPEMSKSDGCVSSHSISPQQSSARNACGTNTKERNSSLVRIKEEPEEEPLQRPEEAAGSTQTLPGVKGEDDADEHMKTQAYINYWVPSSQPASDDRSESDITEDSDGWEETMEEDQPALNKLDSHATENMEGQRLSLSNELSRDSPSQPSPPTSAQTEDGGYICTECGNFFGKMSDLKQHTRTFCCSKTLTSTANSKGFDFKFHSETPFVCTICEKHFSKNRNLEKHMINVHPPGLIQGN